MFLALPVAAASAEQSSPATEQSGSREISRPAPASADVTASDDGQKPEAGPPAAKVAAPESQQPPAASRQAAIEQEQAAKVPTLHPYVPIKGERIFQRLDTLLAGGGLKWHPFFTSAYSGGGFTLGAGYNHHVSSYNTIDARGSYTITGYKRAEVEFLAPRIFNRRGSLSLLGGWREATQVGFYGIGTDTSKDDRDQLPVPAAVRLGPPHCLPDAAELHAAGRRRVLDVVAGARRGVVTLGGDAIHAR